MASAGARSTAPSDGRDVADVDERSPGRAVGRHSHLAGRPGDAHQVVEHDVEPHPRARAERGRVAQERGMEVVARHRADVTLHEHLALGVGRLRVDRRLLGDRRVAADPVDAARRHVDEARHAGLATEARQADAPAGG